MLAAALVAIARSIRKSNETRNILQTSSYNCLYADKILLKVPKNAPGTQGKALAKKNYRCVAAGSV
jgi:hypothetical protein